MLVALRNAYDIIDSMRVPITYRWGAKRVGT